ncbi:unnamed protein product [Rotaria sp. Silwood2]|nr:unnamed protein product [Rotaria sp. Silwood2]CAF3222927.1 unnamed protein product [Rotaria sp. Silwood2]CAF3407390.1 unnamed protein product [Rotaria sp. Silwood2]CAF3524012.1 unnamed protein product [Rotaria sp. Silwood2]CAF4606716.1 unnamed protein product [Rotaria sp. Silwood2]
MVVLEYRANFTYVQKFEPEILVWIAVSENGVSKPSFAKQKQAINQETYFRDCIVARLILFIQSDHIKENVWFWSDLAISHYSHKVMEYLDENGVQMVHKESNPQNCPQSRLIET